MDEAAAQRFRDFAADAIPRLHRVALAATRDPHRADDLVQGALERVYARWGRLDREAASPIAYARTVLMNGVRDEYRRGWRRNEDLRSELPDGAALAAVSEVERVVDRIGLLAALDRLTARQRAAVVLRHIDGLSVAEVARLTRTSESNVKAACREGLALLRGHLAAGSDVCHEGMNQ